MNTQIVSELFILNNVQNDPIIYKDKDDQHKEQNRPVQTGDHGVIFSWLIKILGRRREWQETT